MKSANPLKPFADLRNEEFQGTVISNPYWEKRNGLDTDGDGDDDADDDDDDDHVIHDARRSNL